MEKAIILNNVRSVHNVGSAFRTADASGVSKIYLVGITPTPLDRFGRKRSDLAKVALGAEEGVKWEYAENILELINKLKKEDFYTVAVEQDPESKNYKDIKKHQKMCFVFGSETEGLSKDLLKEVDEIAEIPMLGEKESLNVSVTVGIILYQFI